jgi:hypothetical protein
MASLRWVHGNTCLILILLLSPLDVSTQRYNSQPVLLRALGTYEQCIQLAVTDEAAIDQCNAMGNATSLTVIRALVSPERKSSPSGTGDDLVFSRFPEPTSFNNPNFDPIDQETPCTSTPGEQCNLFGTGQGNNTASQFRVIFESSTYVRSYTLNRKQVTIPYAYLDYNADILGCELLSVHAD